MHGGLAGCVAAVAARRAVLVGFALRACDTSVVHAALSFRTAHAGTADDVGLTAHRTQVADAANLPLLTADALAVVAAVLRLAAADIGLTDASRVDRAALTGTLAADLRFAGAAAHIWLLAASL